MGSTQSDFDMIDNRARRLSPDDVNDAAYVALCRTWNRAPRAVRIDFLETAPEDGGEMEPWAERQPRPLQASAIGLFRTDGAALKTITALGLPLTANGLPCVGVRNSVKPATIF